MRTIAVINLKGGVGKTTTVINTAAILARDYRQRVLLIDADSQCNTTDFFGVDDATPSLADLLRDTASGVEDVVEEYIHSTGIKGVDMIPADVTLMDLDLTKVELGSVQAGTLRGVRTSLEEVDAYDWCLVDCPPGFNAASAAALVAADEVIIPIKLDAFSLRGMANMMQQIANMRTINADLRLGGLLPTQWYNSPKIVEAEEELRKSGLPVYPHIRRSNKVDDMTFLQDPLVMSSPRSAAGVDYRRFVQALFEEVFCHG